MKYLLLIGIFLSISTTAIAQSFNTEDPVTYNNYIVAEQSELMSKVVEYIVETVHNNNYREVESKRLEVIGQIEMSINKLKQMAPFKGDSQMKDEALAVFKLYREAYVNDYSQINMLKKDRESSFKAMEMYFNAQDQAEEKLQQTAQKFTLAQQEFAKNNNMKIAEAERDGTMSAIAEVNKYSRKVFLEFFKISKLNGKCLDALNSQDAAIIEAARIALLEGSQSAKDNLTAFSAFKGNNEFRSRTLAYVAYHTLFAQNEVLELKRILETEDRTNEDIDRYNEIIQTYNKDIQTLIKNFNDANVNLLRQHIPNMGLSIEDGAQKG